MDGKVKIAIFVSGGVVQDVRAAYQNVEVTLVDEDDMKEGGLSRSQRDSIINRAEKAHPHVVF